MSESRSGSLAARLLRPFAEVRSSEAMTALLMFAYSFLAMTSYNIIQPITRSKFISDLGADNVPYVQFAAGILIGLIMQVYVKAISLVPARWVVPASQTAIVFILVGFWALFQTGQEWVSVSFYFLGLIFAILLVSQFWSLANAIYDPRQAKRIFGFIGAGTSLGGMTGAGLTSMIAERVGTNALLLWSAGAMTLCIAIVVLVLRRESQAIAGPGGEEEIGGLGPRETLQLFMSSRQVRLIAVVISFGALGAVILDQQVNMATEEFKGRGATDSITAFLGTVRFWISAAGFAIQIFLTSRIHRLLGIAFALMVLPVNLGIMAGVILTNYALWAPALGTIVDRSFRYTVDKTTREILFLPLPLDVKLQAKPFVDVTVDRLAKGIGALVLVVLIQPWGLGLTWQQLSYASLALVAVWFVMAVRAKREYVAEFRRSIEAQNVKPAEVRLDTADLNTIETLVTELSHPDPRRVTYAIDLLESLDKRHLVTPLLLHHESAPVRARALAAAAAAGADRSGHWARGVERALKDADSDVRLAAVRALAALRHENVAEVMRPYLQAENDPELVVTAACALAESESEADREQAEAALQRLSTDTREQAAPIRLEVARALGQVRNPAFRPLLVPLMFDANRDVAGAAIASAGRLGAAPGGDFLFVPPLVSLMRNRLLKAPARQVLVGYGEDVVDALAYFMRDQDEDIWVRRHVPTTLGFIPSQRSLDVLVAALEDDDGFIRYKAGAAVERLRRSRPELALDRTIVERQILQEATRAFSALTLHHNLFVTSGLDGRSVLSQVLQEKRQRAINRIFRLLGLLYSPDDIGAVRGALNSPDARLRSGATEYLDNLLSGDIRKRVMLLVEDIPANERIRKGNVIFKTRERDVEDTVTQLVHDEDQIIAAAAIQLVEQRQMWTLAEDLEYALAHRDPRDWFVFEAASWALAARRMPAERRRALWLEPLPAVELADRIRRIQLFDYASIDELFRIAGLGRQVRHEAGRILYEAGRSADTLQFLLDGRVAVVAENGIASEIQAPAVLALEPVLEGTPMRATIRAIDPVISLSLTTEEFLSLLSENVEIAQGIFRMLIDTQAPREWQTIMHGELPRALERKAAGGLPAVDRVLLLQSSPLLARATAPQLLALAQIARPVTLTPGTDPLSGVEPSTLVVLSGSVRVEADGQPPQMAGAGDTLGVYETLSGASPQSRAEVVEAGQALRFIRSELFDLLADNIDLLQGIFSALLHRPGFNNLFTTPVLTSPATGNPTG
jgi:ATP/ADP translocase/HEAT repeat protein/CRP-like cAMP-binding protein